MLRSITGARDGLLLRMIADETLGYNAIPDAMAQVLGRDLDLPVIAGEIVQTSKVGSDLARQLAKFAIGKCVRWS